MTEGKKVVLLIHGYNTDYQESIEFFSRLVKGTRCLYDTFICYFWPGHDDFWEYLDAKSMIATPTLSRRLSKLIEELARTARQVDSISFSAGCRLVLEALNHASKPLFTNLFLLAPAIDNESIEKGERYAPGINKAQKAFVFYSKNDRVLGWAYPFADWDIALGSRGLENPQRALSNVYMVNSSAHIQGHNDYSISPFIFTIISNVIREEAFKAQPCLKPVCSSNTH